MNSRRTPRRPISCSAKVEAEGVLLLPDRPHVVADADGLGVLYDFSRCDDGRTGPDCTCRSGMRCDAFYLSYGKAASDAGRVLYLVELKGQLDAEVVERAVQQLSESLDRMSLAAPWRAEKVVVYTGTRKSDVSMYLTKNHIDDVTFVATRSIEGGKDHSPLHAAMTRMVRALPCR